MTHSTATLALLALLSGCSLAGGRPPAGPETPVTGLAAVQLQPASQVMTLQGEYAQWTGGCKGSPPVSRGDWMLKDEGGCLYVHGPRPATPQGSPITVEGTLKALPDGRRYLDASRVTPR